LVTTHLATGKKSVAILLAYEKAQLQPHLQQEIHNCNPTYKIQLEKKTWLQSHLDLKNHSCNLDTEKSQIACGGNSFATSLAAGTTAQMLT
jgi:hypothetical protein